jgi:peroxiredoxin
MSRLPRIAAVFTSLIVAIAAVAAPQVGQPAPDFTATDSQGASHSLSQMRGKVVVLEWTNADCPYTRKHYTSGNMQSIQTLARENGVIWLSVISSAPGKQGYVTAQEENAYLKEMNAAPTAVLLDPTGALGHLYDAKTTPHMFVINPQGILIYNGAIDDHPTSDASDIPHSQNYLSLALEEALAGKPVAVATSRPYGCSVKYAN